jgi:K+-sensing histidine kinase KdpD
MLVLVIRARRAGGEVPVWWWVVNAIIEPLFPTVAILILPQTVLFDPYSALTSPAAFVYFFFVILSVLHLNIWLSRLTGLCAAVSFAAVVWWVFRTFPDHTPTYVRTIYFTYAAFLLLGGLVAGAVADQVRFYVRVSIREAGEREQLTRDLDIARDIQQGLLPSEPIEVEGFEIAGWSRPAAETGGDYFDWQRLPDERA